MLTLTEASKLIQNPLQRGVVETFARTSPVLERLPFMDVNGNAYSYNVEQTLPGIAFRDYNTSYTESTGVVNPHTEKLYIMGGISSVDRALVKTQGSVNKIRAIHDNMKARQRPLRSLPSSSMVTIPPTPPNLTDSKSASLAVRLLPIPGP